MTCEDGAGPGQQLLLVPVPRPLLPPRGRLPGRGCLVRTCSAGDVAGSHTPLGGSKPAAWPPQRKDAARPGRCLCVTSPPVASLSSPWTLPPVCMARGQPRVPRVSPVHSPRPGPLPGMGTMSADGRGCMKCSFPEGSSNNNSRHYHYRNRYQLGSSQETRAVRLP